MSSLWVRPSYAPRLSLCPPAIGDPDDVKRWIAQAHTAINELLRARNICQCKLSKEVELTPAVKEDLLALLLDDVARVASLGKFEQWVPNGAVSRLSAAYGHQVTLEDVRHLLVCH